MRTQTRKLRDDISQFGEWLESKMESGEIEEGKQYNRGFCSVCRRTHPRAWFRHQGRPEVFYLCWVDEPKVVERTSRDYVPYEVLNYAAKYPLNRPVKRRPW
jgi:hypothetical protein